MIKSKGFTLIELLVVISIIGLLASVVMVSLNRARSSSKDVKSIADLKQITIALELYMDANSGYPGTDGTWYDINGYNSSYADFSTIMPSTYMSLPSQTSNHLWYQKLNATDYLLAFIPENTSYLSQDQDCYIPATYYCISP